MKKDLVVVKFGSELVVAQGGLDRAAIKNYAAGLAQTYQDQNLIVVTSGAVAAGRVLIKQSGQEIDDYSDVTLAQLGSASILRAWELAFEEVGVLAGGLLVTHHEIDDSEGPSFLRALQLASDRGVVSILNENDALSDTELMELACGGDNDGLASHIARAVHASRLILFTKQGGVAADSGEIITEITTETIDSIRRMLQARTAEQKVRGTGRGGIPAKVEAAWQAAQQGIDVRIASVNNDMHGDKVTRFVIG